MRTLPLLAALLALAGPAEAGLRATYSQPDGKQLVVEVADNGAARIGEPGRDEYGLLLPDGFYIVSNEGGEWRTARITDVAAAIDQVLPPIFKDIFAAGSTRKPPADFRIEAKGAETIAGRPGKVYAVYGMSDARPTEAETFVMSDDPALKAVGQAMEQFMNGAMVPAAALIGPAAADIVAETRAIFALGTPLDAGGRFKLANVEAADVPASAVALPVKPQTTAELVAMMRASMAMPR
jgi:hypothetical protein